MTLFDEMVAQYAPQNPVEKLNAQHEVMQQIVLAGLQRGGFFAHAAFYGGTCLRIFHGLRRFSEDMDFSLVDKNPNVHLEEYFPSIVEEFKITGREVDITKRDKKTFGKIESAFLKDNTEIYNMAFRTEKQIKIKIELDTDPPLRFDTEQKQVMAPYAFNVRCVSLPCLYAGKMHALVFRNWKTRVKGRDWYDFEWYVRNGIELDYDHLHERIKEFNGKSLDKDEFIALLNERLSSTSINLVKQDVDRFVRNPRELDFWSNDYFLELAKKIRFKEATV